MRATSAFTLTIPPYCQAGDRKVMVENTTDVTRVAYAALRALKERIETVCFVTGHGETFRPTQAHFHYSHVETLQGP